VKWGVFAGIALGIVLHSLNIYLVGKYASLMQENARIDFWLRSGWTSVSTVMSILTVTVGMWIGTVIGGTADEEQERVREFFSDLNRPFEVVTETGNRPSPFAIIGLLLAMFGAVMIVVAVVIGVFYGDTRACCLDLAVGVAMTLLGVFLRWKSQPKTVFTPEA
jgi:hypothetical protein